jgi:hypothetical protein
MVELAQIRPSSHSPAAEGRSVSKTIRPLIIAIFTFNVLSALLFMHFINRPVYDDHDLMADVHNYATKGVSVTTIRAHRNSPGPVSFVWMAAAVRLLHGEELRDARIGSLVSWVLLVSAILIGARYSSFPQLWYGALLTALVFPHSVEATALVLTEGPALFFAILGSLAWVEFTSRPETTPGVLLLGIAGGLSIGLAAASRQYFLALLPAALILAVQQSRTRGLEGSGRWWATTVISLAVAALPILLLVAIWKGLSSPGMATGTSYALWTARVGLNLSRPIIATFYAAFYLLPLTFPAMSQLEPSRRRRAIWVALAGGAAAGYCSSFILQWGPLRSVVRFLARGTTGQHVLFGLIAAVTIYNAIATAHLLWRKRSAILSCPPAVFAVLTVIFFVGEQFGVGGNIGLYERYLLQLAPFLGLIAFWLFPRLTRARVLALVFMSLVSHIMLWRYAFGPAGS